MKLVLATNNRNKIFEIKKILGEFFTDTVTLFDLGLNIDIEETGQTFEENSFIKAKTICDLTGMSALADDSGLCVDALNGLPGVYSARFAGEEHDDEANIDKLLKEMEGEKNRTAFFKTAITLIYPNGNKFCAVGETKGEITTKRIGLNGFGYDPVFFSYELNKTFGEADDYEKNAISHRGKALQQLKEILLKNQ